MSRYIQDNTPVHCVKPPKVSDEPLFYFYDDIGEVKDYCDFVYTLDHAQPGDVIHVHLATGGGNMEAAIVMVHALMRTQATVIGYADAGVASAGTIILLACDEQVIAPFAHFLFHDGSLQSPGMKFSENLKQAKAICAIYAKLAYSIYSPFFTDDEISEILEGRDYYITAEDMAERVENAKLEFAKMDEEQLVEEE
jgi:ATP-dependent Clp protease, protease subunit